MYEKKRANKPFILVGWGKGKRNDVYKEARYSILT